MTDNRKVPRRIAQTVLNSLKGGVVPRIGLPYVTVGRKNEIEALLRDVDIIEVSVVLIPAYQNAVILETRDNEPEQKAGRRNSAADE